MFFSRSSDQENATCAKSPVAIPPAIIEPGFVAVAQAQAGAARVPGAAAKFPNANQPAGRDKK